MNKARYPAGYDAMTSGLREMSSAAELQPLPKTFTQVYLQKQNIWE